MIAPAPFLTFLTVLVFSSPALTSPSLFQRADTDGDGHEEVWDVRRSTYSDPSKSSGLANRLTETLLIGTTRILLIDIYRKSSVPVPADFDGVPDAVWHPFSGIVNYPVLKDFDGDGFTDLGLDLDNNQIVDGVVRSGSFRPFGALSITALDARQNPIPNAKVTLVLPECVQFQKTGQNGKTFFTLSPVYGSPGLIKVDSEGVHPITEKVPLDQWNENSFSFMMAAVGVSQEGLNAQHYPNPIQSGGTVHLDYFLPASVNARLDLYDIHFRIVKSVFSANQSGGIHTVSFSARDDQGEGLEKGLYFGVLRAGNEKQILKIVVK